MNSETILDYAVFQLSPKRSRCELFVLGDGKTEKLASGLLKPFVTHLTVAEEQAARAVQSIKLEVDKRKNAGAWFTKGTLERFVRFVSTPEVLELVNTFDAEMSQLEGARRIYSQGMRDQLSGALGGDETEATEAADITKKELLRAIDVRLAAVKQDLTTACARASAAGFTPNTISELQLFAEKFGAHRLNEACDRFTSLCQRRPDLINTWKAGGDDRAVRSSSGSDMSIDDPAEENVLIRPIGSHQHQNQQHRQQQQRTSHERDATQLLEQVKPSTCQQPKSSLTFPILLPVRESSSERDEAREEGTVDKGEEDKQESVTESSQVSQPSRRLSVHDRIKLFENKQKEQSGSGGKVVVGKSAELRRIHSDVSSTPQVVEKAVLRRWSGASDMSVELSDERKETDSTTTTPCSASNSQTQFSKFPIVNEDKGVGGSGDMGTSSKAELKGLPGRLDGSGLKDSAGEMESETQWIASSGRSEDVFPRQGLTSQTQLNALSGMAETVGWKGQTPSETKSQSFSGGVTFSGGDEDVHLKNQAVSRSKVKSYPTGVEHVVLQDQVTPQNLFRTHSVGAERTGVKDQGAYQMESRILSGRVEDVQSKERMSQTQSGASSSKTDDVGLRDQLASQALFRASPNTTVRTGSNSKHPLINHTRVRSFSGKLEGGADLVAYQEQGRGFEGDQLPPRFQWRSFPGKVEDVGRKELLSSETGFGDLPTKVEDSSLQGMKLKQQRPTPEQSKKLQGRKSQRIPFNGNDETFFSGKNIMENPEMFASSTTPIEQAEKIRQPKGNQELNDELAMKANELEKLFAAHKLRIPGDQSASVRRTKAADVHVEQVASSIYRKPTEVTPIQMPGKNPVREPLGSSGNMEEFDVSLLMKMVDNPDNGDNPKQNVSEFGLLEDSRGKFYDRYMQKRDAKLREEWGSKRAQKEAKMRAMQDSLECSRAEMKAKFTGTADRQDSALRGRQRAEKLRSFNVCLASKNIEQAGESAESEEEDLSKFPEGSQYGQDRFLSETSLGHASSRSTQSKKLLPNRSLSSSTPRTSAAPVPRSSAKGSNSNSGRRLTPPENPLAQSVPNFSDFRKENTKPSLGITKTTTRSQSKNYGRSKSTSEELLLVKEDKPRRSHSLRKSSASPGELKDLSSRNSDGVILTPLKFAKEQTDQSICSKIPKSGESKPFLRKGNGIGPGAGVGVAKFKASTASENLKNKEESNELADQPQDSVDMGKDDVEEEEFGIVSGEAVKDKDFSADSDNEKSRLSQESEKSGDPGSENGEVLRSLSQVDPNSVVDMDAEGPTALDASVGPVQDSPGESPASWNSRIHHPFSYANETSDIDASVDSPVGSPALWNSHSLSQMESDAARMRRKWGSAQKPILVANSSHNHSRKDMTKGIKRLLKFGRKSRGSESLVDWISATTSEGDDDTEDVRDPANRSSEDLRKSRMGLSQGHPSYDGFNDGELFNEQDQALHSSIPAPPATFKLREDHPVGSSLKAPRSFFSLSSFRNKGSESKPR